MLTSRTSHTAKLLHCTTCRNSILVLLLGPSHQDSLLFFKSNCGVGKSWQWWEHERVFKASGLRKMHVSCSVFCNVLWCVKRRASYWSTHSILCLLTTLTWAETSPAYLTSLFSRIFLACKILTGTLGSQQDLQRDREEILNLQHGLKGSLKSWDIRCK